MRSIVDDVGHQYGQQLGHSVDTSSESPIGGGTARRLAGLACSFYPLAGYRIYDIEYAQFVGARCLFEVGEDLLDENGFILVEKLVSLMCSCPSPASDGREG